jgi:hypothetical protein
VSPNFLLDPKRQECVGCGIGKVYDWGRRVCIDLSDCLKPNYSFGGVCAGCGNISVHHHPKCSNVCPEEKPLYDFYRMTCHKKCPGDRALNPFESSCYKCGQDQWTKDNKCIDKADCQSQYKCLGKAVGGACNNCLPYQWGKMSGLCPIATALHFDQNDAANNIPGCLSYNSISKKCTLCLTGFRLRIFDGICESIPCTCSCEHCMVDDFDKEECIFEYDATDRCLLKNLRDQTCYQCISGYTLTQTPNKTLPACLQDSGHPALKNCRVSNKDNISCHECKQGYYQSSATNDLCKRVPAYFLDLKHRTCQKCHPSCETCTAKGKNSCDTCPNGTGRAIGIPLRLKD